jgi:DnaK suppressor protein
LPEERQVLTDHREIQLACLRQALEEQYQLHTEQLTELTVRSSDGEDTDPEITQALIASCRQTLAEIAHALRYMAEGGYGVCEACEQDIPMERLEILPHARFCAPCQRKHTRTDAAGGPHAAARSCPAGCRGRGHIADVCVPTLGHRRPRGRRPDLPGRPPRHDDLGRVAEPAPRSSEWGYRGLPLARRRKAGRCSTVLASREMWPL